MIGGALALVILGSLCAVAAWLWRTRIYRHFFHPIISARKLRSFRELPVQTGDVVFLGDSLTSQGRWGEWFPGVPVRNRGISGDTTADVLARLGEVVRTAPAQIFLMVGTNDLGLGVRQEVVLENVAAIVTEIRRATPQTEIYLQTLLPRDAAYVERIAMVNQGLALLAEKEGLVLIDVGRAMSSSTGTLRAELTRDSLHLEGAGYAVWRKALAPFVGTPSMVWETQQGKGGR